jgi:hypothetical protein
MLGRYAGATVPELARTTGMAPSAVQAIVERLTELGLLGDEPAGPEPAPRAHASAPPRAQEEAAHAQDDLVALLDAATFDLLPGPSDAPAGLLPAHPEGRPAPRRTPVSRREIEEAIPPEPSPAEEPAAAEDDDGEPAAEEPVEETREYKKLFEQELHPLPVDERVALAGTVSGAKLFALCFDPVPAVIHAIFRNTAASIEHARLVAFHHRDSRGLEELCGRPQVIADGLVHRRLVRNPATTEAQLRRLIGTKRLLVIYKVSLDRDVPERSRAAARNLLRSKFTTAQAEERVELVWGTEGRVLLVLTGCTFDSRMTSILCSKTYASMMLVQALARFPATPPALVAYLLRQPIVKRQQHLKNQLLQHQNCPSEAKRRM